MSDHVAIRTATPADASMLTDFAARTFAAAWGAHPEEMQPYIDAHFTVPLIEGELLDPDIRYFLITVDGDFAGYAKMKPGAPEKLGVGARPLELCRIYVDPSLQNMKLGSRLMAHCIDFALGGGYENLWLLVWDQNAAAVRFYERWGFRKLGTQRFRWARVLDTDYVMHRSLKGDS